MVKKRPVVVIAKHKENSQLLTIIPISSKKPENIRQYHIEVDSQFCQLYLTGNRCWFKCDMINVVSLKRLDLVRDRQSGLRHAPNIGKNFLMKIKNAVRLAHGL